MKITYSNENDNYKKNEDKPQFTGKFKNFNEDNDIKAPKRNYNDYNINNKYYGKKEENEEEKENEPEKVVFKNSKKEGEESNENLKDLDTKGDLFLEKFKKISEQSNLTERKEPRKKFSNYYKGNSNEENYIKEDYNNDDNENYYSYRKNYNRKKYNNYYSKEYNNDDEIINQFTNGNKYNNYYEEEKKIPKYKIIKKMSEDKNEKKNEKTNEKINENLHEKVVAKFDNKAKNLKDLLG